MTPAARDFAGALLLLNRGDIEKAVIHEQRPAK
jgi:hypothetical protein